MSAPDEISRFAEALGIDLPPGAPEQLEGYASLLSSRGPALGLVAQSDAGRVLERHVLDSLRAVRAVVPSDRVAYDLGSGGGLPGVPVAIAVRELSVTLVESRRLRASWLELVVEELGLANSRVVHGRIEDLTGPADLCLARALGPLERSWELARGLLAPKGRLVYFAGERFDPGQHRGIHEQIRILDESGLESRGPLVIIGRQ